MKKKFLTVLLAIVAALCLCFGLAACRDDPGKPKDPPAGTGSVEGVWSGATGKAANATLTVDVDGNAAHAVMKEVGNEETKYVYFSFAKAENGSYAMAQGSGNGASTTIKVNAQNQLEWMVVPPASAEGAEAQTTVFPTKAELPAALNITGAKYAMIAGTVAEINFGTAPAIKYGEDALTGVNLVNVGGYKVLTAKYDEDDVTVIAFHDGTANKAYVVVTNVISQTVDLSDTKPTPPATEDFEGYWTGAVAAIYDGENTYTTDFTFTAAVDIDGEQAKVIYMIADYEGGVMGEIWSRDYLLLEKQNDGSYKYVVTNEGGTSTFEIRMIENKLQMVITDLFSNEDPVVLNFTAKQEPAAAPDVSGIKYTEHEETVVEIDLGASPAVKYGETPFTDVECIDFDPYKLLTGKYNGNNASVILVDEEGTLYAYTSIRPCETGKEVLMDTKPLTAEDVKGEWMGATVTGIFGDGTFDLTAVIDPIWRSSGYIILLAKTAAAAVNAPAEYALAVRISKEGEQYNGSLKVSPSDTYNLAITFANDKLTVTGLGDDALEFTTKQALSAQIDMPREKLYADDGNGGTIEFGFDYSNITVPGDDRPVNAEYRNVGAFIVVMKMGYEAESEAYVIFKDGDTYYYFGAEEPIELTAHKA